MLNMAILTMFLEEEAPHRVKQADKMLEDFRGHEDDLFQQLATVNPKAADGLLHEVEVEPHVFDLQSAEDTESPAWKKFVAQRKNRMSHRGFFGRVESGDSSDAGDDTLAPMPPGGTAKKGSFTGTLRRSLVARRASTGSPATGQGATESGSGGGGAGATTAGSHTSLASKTIGRLLGRGSFTEMNSASTAARAAEMAAPPSPPESPVAAASSLASTSGTGPAPVSALRKTGTYAERRRTEMAAAMAAAADSATAEAS